MTSQMPSLSRITRRPTEPRIRVIQNFAERGGGAALDEPCRPRPLQYLVTDPDTKKERSVTVQSNGCGTVARVGVTYRNAEGHEDITIACIVDDAVDLWPRFNGDANGRPEEPV